MFAKTGQHLPERHRAAPSAVRHANFMVLRDRKPFLIVNATPAHVEALIAGFRRGSDYAWSFSAIED
jgi:hypothetical protein